MEMSPQLRRLSLAAAAALTAAVALAVGFFAFLHTGPGERWVSGKLEENVAGLELDGFRLGWPFRMRADALRLGDARGTWLEARQFELVWHPHRLWRRALDIDRLAAQRVDVFRLPEAGEDSGDGGSVPLPDSLHLDEVKLPIMLAPPVLGQSLALELAGTARMAGGGGPVEMSLRAQGGGFVRIAGTAGLDYLDLRWYLQLPDLSRWQQMAGVPLRGAATGSGVVAGRLPSPEISGRIDLSSGGIDRAGWEQLGLSGRVVPAGALWHLALQADTVGLRWNGQALPIDTATLSLTGDLAPADGRLRLGDGQVTTDMGTLRGAGVIDDWGRHTVLRLNGRTSMLGGQLAARGVVAGDLIAGRLDGLIDVRGRELTTGTPVLDRALGPVPRARLDVAVRGDRVLLGPSRLNGAGTTLQAAGMMFPRLDAWARLDVPDGGRLLPSLSGGATAFAHVGGSTQAPSLAGIATLDDVGVSGAPPGSGTIAFDLPDPARPRGYLSADLSVAGTPLNGQARLERAGGIRLDDLTLASGPSQIRGELVFANGIRGRLNGSIPELRQWEGLLGRPLSGRVEAEAVLDPQRGQSLRLSARGSDLTVAGLAVPNAQLSLSAEGLTARDRRVVIEDAAATADGIPLRLTAPTRLDWRGNDLTLAPARLAVGSGRAEVAARLSAGTLAAQLRLTALPLALAADGLAGTIAGTVEVNGPLASPLVRFDLSGRDLALARGEPAALGRLAGETQGEWRNGRLSGRVELSDGRALRLTAQGNAMVPGSGTLDARLHADGDIARLSEAVSLGAHVIAGRLEVAADVAGTIDAPRLNGRGILRNGRYENVDSGTIVTALAAEAILAGDRVNITARGQDGGQGKLQLEGAGTLTGDYGADVTLDRFTVLRRDDVEASVSGALRLEDGRLSGRLTVPRAEVDVGRIKGGGPVHLDVVEINRAGQTRPQPPRRQRTQGDSGGPALTLAVDGRVEHAFVRGRGLDSEWKGDLQVGGTTTEPSLTGRLTAVRGQLDVLGKVFRLTENSAVTFQGGTPPDPALDVTAEAGTADITAQVKVTGTAKAPEMAFTSSPPLPQDEVLARLLFGREAGKLSAFQQLQLAQMAAGGLTGDEGGFDPVGELRGFLGLDVLGFGSETGAGGKENPTVSAGRYVGRDTFVRVDQGTAGLGRVTVEQGVGAGFSVESYVGEQSGGGVGLTWRKDY